MNTNMKHSCFWFKTLVRHSFLKISYILPLFKTLIPPNWIIKDHIKSTIVINFQMQNCVGMDKVKITDNTTRHVNIENRHIPLHS